MKDVEQRSKDDTQPSIPLVMMMMILVTRSGGWSTDEKVPHSAAVLGGFS